MVTALLLHTRDVDPRTAPVPAEARAVQAMRDSAAAAVRRAGLEPLAVPAGDVGSARCSELARDADLVVVLGGIDVSPSLYGGGRGYDGSPAAHDPEADAAQLGAALQAMADGTPLLGICRGMQLIAAGLGAALVQHLPGEQGSAHRRPGPLADSLVGHAVAPSNRMSARLRLPEPEGEVLSSHHQAVYGPSLPAELAVLSRSHDGVVEAIGHREAPFLGVQWHPEHPDAPQQHMDSLLAALLSASHPSHSLNTTRRSTR